MKPGYIGITDPNAFDFMKNKNHEEFVWWCKSPKPVNLNQGTYFFFLVKGTKPRYIRGYGIVKFIGSETLKNLWGKYGNKTATDSLSDFEFSTGNEENDKVGFYFLEHVKYIDEGIDLNDLEIEFNHSIVRGKGIDDEDTKKILSSFGDESKYKPISIEDSFQRKKKHSKKG